MQAAITGGEFHAGEFFGMIHIQVVPFSFWKSVKASCAAGDWISAIIFSELRLQNPCSSAGRCALVSCGVSAEQPPTARLGKSAVRPSGFSGRPWRADRELEHPYSFSTPTENSPISSSAERVTTPWSSGRAASSPEPRNIREPLSKRMPRTVTAVEVSA